MPSDFASPCSTYRWTRPNVHASSSLYSMSPGQMSRKPAPTASAARSPQVQNVRLDIAINENKARPRVVSRAGLLQRFLLPAEAGRVDLQALRGELLRGVRAAFGA